MFGINGAEFLIIALIAVVVVGPERLPRYAEQLGRWVRNLRGYADQAKARVADEIAEDGETLDWQALDPRTYDPRRIVREALLEQPPTTPPPVTGRVTTTGRRAAPAGAAAATDPGPGDGTPPAPFDDEAT